MYVAVLSSSRTEAGDVPHFLSGEAKLFRNLGPFGTILEGQNWKTDYSNLDR